MNPKIMSVEAKATTPKERFDLTEFKRLLRICCRYPRPLLAGFAATVLFACLHTVSIGAAFPVFKILLEEERIDVWLDRTVAARRLGVVFFPATDPERVRLLEVALGGEAYRKGLRSGDELQDPDNRSVFDLLGDLAGALPGEGVAVRLTAVGAPSAHNSDIVLTPGPIDRAGRFLRRVGSWLPEDIEQSKLRTLGYILIGLVGVVFIANLFRYLGEIWIARAILQAMMDLRSRLYDRTLQLPMSFFSSRKTADIVGRFVQDIQEIQRGMMTLFSKFMREPLRALFLLALAFALDWRLTLAVVVVAPIAVFMFWHVGKRVKRSNRKLLAAWGEMIGTLTASLQSLRVVKTYTAEPNEQRRLREVDSRALRQQLKLAKLQALVSPAMETVAVLAGSLVTLWLANQVLSRSLPISQFATLGVALTMLFP